MLTSPSKTDSGSTNDSGAGAYDNDPLNCGAAGLYCTVRDRGGRYFAAVARVARSATFFAPASLRSL